MDSSLGDEKSGILSELWEAGSQNVITCIILFIVRLCVVGTYCLT